MSEQTIETRCRIITRNTKSGRWIATLYVRNQKRYETMDHDTESSCYVQITKRIHSNPELLQWKHPHEKQQGQNEKLEVNEKTL